MKDKPEKPDLPPPRIKRRKYNKRLTSEEHARRAGAKVPARNNRLSEGKAPKNFSNNHLDLTLFDMYILEWLTSHFINLGYAPTLKEIQEHYGFPSKKLVLNKLEKLESCGFISIDDKVERGIRINSFPKPEDLASQRLKQWLIEAVNLLKKHSDISNPDVQKFISKADIFAF